MRGCFHHDIISLTLHFQLNGWMMFVFLALSITVCFSFVSEAVLLLFFFISHASMVVQRAIILATNHSVYFFLTNLSQHSFVYHSIYHSIEPFLWLPRSFWVTLGRLDFIFWLGKLQRRNFRSGLEIWLRSGESWPRDHIRCTCFSCGWAVKYGHRWFCRTREGSFCRIRRSVWGRRMIWGQRWCLANSTHSHAEVWVQSRRRGPGLPGSRISFFWREALSLWGRSRVFCIWGFCLFEAPFSQERNTLWH